MADQELLAAALKAVHGYDRISARTIRLIVEAVERRVAEEIAAVAERRATAFAHDGPRREARDALFEFAEDLRASWVVADRIAEPKLDDPTLEALAFVAGYACAARETDARVRAQVTDETLEAVRAIHHPAECVNVRCSEEQWCIGCDPDGAYDCRERPWPCETLRAIEALAGFTPSVEDTAREPSAGVLRSTTREDIWCTWHNLLHRYGDSCTPEDGEKQVPVVVTETITRAPAGEDSRQA